VKFEGKIPNIREVEEAFEGSPHVAFVALTKGIYDMILIFYLESTHLIANFIYDWRSSGALSDYTAKWYISPLSMAIGITTPLRKQTVDWIVTKPAIKNSSETSVISQLTEIEGLVLKELSIDGNQNFGDIDKMYKLNFGRSNYAFYKLKEKGVVERVTLTISPFNLRYNSVFITETNNYKKFTENQDKWRLDVISQDNPLVSKNVFIGDMGTPDAIFHIRPIFDETSFQKTKERLDNILGTKTDTMVITQVIIGSLCYRNFDPVYTPFYDMLVKHGLMPQQDKTTY
jgi:DNA-binding Lrp family transcriptional regulator